MSYSLPLNFAPGTADENLRSVPMAVYVVDDHVPMRASLDALLSGVVFNVALFASAEEFLASVPSLTPGVVLSDLRMSGMDGLDLVASLIEILGERHRQFPTVIMTAHGDIDSAVRAIRLGARDFIQKPFRETELVDILEREGRALQHAGVADAVRETARAKLAGLSPREREIVQELVLGRTNKMIAHHLNLSVRTVEMHRSRAMDRLHCCNLAELMAIALHGEIFTLVTAERSRSRS